VAINAASVHRFRQAQSVFGNEDAKILKLWSRLKTNLKKKKKYFVKCGLNTTNKY
jgi:hypothetical protein